MIYYRRLPTFEYVAPKSMGEVYSLLKEHRNEARILGGGTILLNRLKERIGLRPTVIGLKAVPGLDAIGFDRSSGLRVGAMATHQSLADTAAVKDHCPLLAAVCARLGTPQIRNMGTLGGNVCCRFSTAETVPALIALKAEARMMTALGEKVAPVEELYKEMKDGDLLIEIRIPPAPADTKTGYKKLAVRERYDYATVSAAVVITHSGKVCKDIAIGLGGVTLQTMRATAAEDVVRGQTVTEIVLKKAAETAAEGAHTGSDLMFPADYKKEVLKVMVERAIREALGT